MNASRSRREQSVIEGMQPARQNSPQYWVLRILPRVVLLGSSIYGWYLAHWIGVVIGFAVGCLLAILAWATLYYFFARARWTKQTGEVTKLSNDQLKEIALNPSSGDLGFAIAELEHRGITNVRPSLDSLLQLLTSTNPKTRGLGYFYLFVMYPDTSQKIAGEGTSSADPPEIWQKRITAFKAAN